MPTEACLVAVTLVLGGATSPDLPAREAPGRGYVDRAEVVLVRPAAYRGGTGGSYLLLRQGAGVYVREVPAEFVGAECTTSGEGVAEPEDGSPAESTPPKDR